MQYMDGVRKFGIPEFLIARDSWATAYIMFPLTLFPFPHEGYITVTEKPARASEQRAWAGF
ncbi:MAG TPA: hypothetical protein DCL44_00630 [Elusimicrobia bacterium]|nr:hypothetical protein [Elusimicrobiota bacterium]